MATFQSPGIILKKTDRGEFDQLFNIYCEKKGKIVALGRGTKKIQSKLNGNLQQFGIINLMIANGKNYDHIASAQLVENFSGIKKDFKKIILASFSLELVEKLTKPGQGEPKVFILLKRFLEAVNNNSLSDREWRGVLQAFVTKLLSILGFQPSADVAADIKKLDKFLKKHLDSQLQTEKFLVKMLPLTI